MPVNPEDFGAVKVGARPEDFGAVAVEKGPVTPAGERFARGLRDPLDAGAQMLTHSLPDSVVGGVNKATQFVNDLPVIGPVTKALGMTPATSGQIDQGIRERESAYVRPDGVDWARAGGNIAATLPAATQLPVASTLLGRVGLGAASGGAFGAFNPVVNNQEDFATEKAKQVGLGAALGGIAAPVMSGIARVVSPETREHVRKLIASGINPTPGQILGGAAQRAEDKLTSIPILGDAITGARRSAVEDLNKAAYGRALEPIKGAIPQAVGRDGVKDVSTQLATAYNNLLPKLQFKADQQFATELSKVQQMAAQLPEQQAKQFDKILQTQVVGKLTPQGNASGETIKAIESELGRMAKGYRGDPSFDTRQLGAAIQETQAAIRRTLERINPAHAQELAAINKGYAAYATVRNAAGRQGSTEGVFSPAQLSAAVRAGDKSVGKGNFARGTAGMQDLSDAAVNVLGPKYPDSGSIGRLLLGGGALGSAALNPAIPAALGVASLPYLPIIRQGTTALLTSRPDLAKPVAEALRKIPAGLLAPLAYQAGNQ